MDRRPNNSKETSKRDQEEIPKDKSNNNLRDQRQTEYHVEKARCHLKINNVKIQSRKQYSN